MAFTIKGYRVCPLCERLGAVFHSRQESMDCRVIMQILKDKQPKERKLTDED